MNTDYMYCIYNEKPFGFTFYEMFSVCWRFDRRISCWSLGIFAGTLCSRPPPHLVSFSSSRGVGNVYHFVVNVLFQVLDELRHLEDFFTTQNKQARQPMVGLYEQAQACTMVLPRLYLLNTVGACYILSKEAPARVSLLL